MRVLMIAVVAMVVGCTQWLQAAEPTTPTEPPQVIGAEVINVPAPAPQIIPPPPILPPPGLQPSPVAPSEPPFGATPLPPLAPVPEGPEQFMDFTAEQIRSTLENGRPVATVATGNVTASYRDMVVTSQRAEVDYRTNIAVFEGNVVFRVGIQEARGDRLVVKIRTGEWQFTQADTVVRPEFARGILQAPIFAQASEVSGYRDQRLSAFDAQVTTCDLPNEHYDLEARSMAIYPGSKIVFRNVTPYFLGRRLFTIPRIVVPLREIESNPNVIPRFGQSAEEGFFLKTSYAYMGTAAQTGFLLLDLMSRKGIGTGIRHNYKYPNLHGEVELYHVYDRNINEDTVTGRLAHLQQLGTVQMSLTSDFRSNSYIYAPQSTSFTNRLVFARDRIGARSSLALNQLIDNTFVRTIRTTGTLQHRQEFSPISYLDTSFDYDAFTRSGDQRSRLTSQALFAKQEKKFDWSISAQKITDLSDESFVGGGQFAGIERLPEVALVSDSTRLGRVLPFGMPARMKFSFGRYNELPADTTYDRTFVSLETPVQRHALSNTWNLAAGGGFRQYIYDSDRAQYAFDASAELSKKLGEQSTFALTYRYQKPQGYTPFRFDFVGRYNIINASYSLQQTDKLKLSILGGYNFEQDRYPWQDIVLRNAYQFSPSFLFYTATAYDINNSHWRALINQFRIRAGSDFRLDVGTRYDTDRKQLSSIRSILDTPIGRKMRLQAVAGYNGISNEFDYRSFRLTRDLHCWEASLIYTDQGGFYPNRKITFNLRLKAFPLFTDFGTGAFGQSLDTSVGQVY